MSRTPWWVEKGLPNPAVNPEVRKRISESGKKSMTPERRKQIGDFHRGKKNPPCSEQNKLAASERMKTKNPMKNRETSAKCRDSLMALITAPGYVHPNIGRKRPDAQIRMNTNNPMKNADTAKRVWGKACATLRAKGLISDGEKRLTRILTGLKLEFEPHKFFKLLKNPTWCTVDFFLPVSNLAIEYDGFSGHHTADGKLYDEVRDCQLMTLHGVSMLRIHRDAVFAKGFQKTLEEHVNELKMGIRPIRRIVGGNR